MDVMLQRHCAKYIYAIPDGLRELMSDISREVLRSNPENIYQFIADYLDALLITRENARVAAKLVENITQVGITIAELLTRTGMSRDKADKVVAIIQIAFRNYLSKKVAAKESKGEETQEEIEVEKQLAYEVIEQAGISPNIANEAATIIQTAWKNFLEQREREKDLLKGMIDWRVAARSTLKLYRKSGVTYEEANRAATLIKAAYKGYYTRRIMKMLLHESVSTPSLPEYSIKDEESEEYYGGIWDISETQRTDDFMEEEEVVEIFKITEDETSEAQTSEIIISTILDSCLKLAIPSDLDMQIIKEEIEGQEDEDEMEDTDLQMETAGTANDTEGETDTEVTESNDPTGDVE